MGKCICYFGEDRFVEWSGIVDAPITWLMSEKELRSYMRDEYGRAGVADLDERIQRAREKGTSDRISSLDVILSGNHAGYKGRHISLEELLFSYRSENASRLWEGGIHTRPELNGSWITWIISPDSDLRTIWEMEGLTSEEEALREARAALSALPHAAPPRP